MTTTTASMQLLHNMSVAHHPLVFSALVSPAAVLHSVRVPRLHGQGLHVSGAAAEGDAPPAVLIIDYYTPLPQTDTQIHHGCDVVGRSTPSCTRALCGTGHPSLTCWETRQSGRSAAAS